MHKFDLNKFQGYLYFVLGIYFKIALNKNFNGKKDTGRDNSSISKFSNFDYHGKFSPPWGCFILPGCPSKQWHQIQLLPVAHPMKPVIFLNGTLPWPNMEGRTPGVNAPRWQEVTRASKTFWVLWFLGISVCTIHVLPLGILNVSTAHANPTVQLRPEPMQTDTCVSAVKMFQGLFSYTLSHIFSFIYFLLEQELFLFEKKKVYLLSCQMFGRNLNFVHCGSSR